MRRAIGPISLFFSLLSTDQFLLLAEKRILPICSLGLSLASWHSAHLSILSLTSVKYPAHLCELIEGLRDNTGRRYHEERADLQRAYIMETAELFRQLQLSGSANDKLQ